MKLLKILSLSLFFSLVLFTSTIFAQSTTVLAEAVVEEPLGVTGTNLNFGSVFPGATETIDKADAAAAQFDITGDIGAEVTVDFTLPTLLADGGGNDFAISFATTDGGWSLDGTQAGATEFDPNVTLTETLDGTTGELYVWLGGQIVVGDPQPAGTYTGDITIDVAYTGL